MGSAGLVAILSVFGFAISMVFFGSIKTSLQRRLGIGDDQVGYLMSALLFASTPAVLLLGLLLDKLGAKRIITFGFVATALCLLLIGWIPSYYGVFAVFLLLAPASSCPNSGGNTAAG